MKQTWRWFGPEDTIAIDLLPQAGVQGVVSALHGRKPGEVWTVGEIRQRQKEISVGSRGQATGLTWDVVESVPVSEAIKTQSGDVTGHYEAYRQTIRNLADCGIITLCYNFMPILDWTRTVLRFPQPHGGTAMLFDLLDFAAFDICILKRANARQDYSDEFVERARERFAHMTDAARAELVGNVIAGLPGAADSWTIEDVRAQLSTYDNTSEEKLRGHMADFLSEVIPTAEDAGVNMCCHPDDPPFGLLGLPRIMSSVGDYEWLVKAVGSPANGVTMCTGSLGVRSEFDGADFVRRLGKHIHFVHLRNTSRQEPLDGDKCSFHEAEHLDGDTDMVATIQALLQEEDRRKAEGRADWKIPMRPDHGQDILDDLTRDSMPGYPLNGRMRGLAELRGVMTALSYQAAR